MTPMPKLQQKQQDLTKGRVGRRPPRRSRSPPRSTGPGQLQRLGHHRHGTGRPGQSGWGMVTLDWDWM